MILIFDYHQNLKAIIGVGTKAIECGAVTAITLSADHSTVAGGHANGSVFTWEIAKPAKPFLQILSTTNEQISSTGRDGHVTDVSVLHLGFLGTRHTALVSADDHGMAFSHLATRGMGSLSRSVVTKRILGRYPDLTPATARPRKPSSVLAFAPLPLGNVETGSDSLGLVAMLTPYLLVIVSTTPVAQTQYKATRPKEVTAHGAMSAALAWYPAMQKGSANVSNQEGHNHARLAYCWLNALTIVDVEEVEASEGDGRERPLELQFRMRKKWQTDESIVAIQWLSRSVLAVLTITQRLILLEYESLSVTDSSDLIKKHIYHVDHFSQQLSQLIEKLDEDNTAMHGVVADAFYMSFRAFKGRLFILGFNDISIGTLSNWADRLLALMEQGDFIGAIRLATSYFSGDADKATVGLPEDSNARHELVRDKLIEMMAASLKYAFGKNLEAGNSRATEPQLEQLANTCIIACLKISDQDFLFEDVYTWYAESELQHIFLRMLENFILDQQLQALPPHILKDLVNDFAARGQQANLEEVLCRLNPETMDLDQVTKLCKKYRLFDALFYVWNQAINDYTTILSNLIDLSHHTEGQALDEAYQSYLISKIFPYLSYILTSRVYPTGEVMSDERAIRAKAEVYHFLFSGDRSRRGSISFGHLRQILDLDTSSFMSVLNEAFEDSFLNGPTDTDREIDDSSLTDEQRFGLSLNRQFVISILLEILVPPEYEPTEIVFLDMFIARNLPKFPQFILLPGTVLHRVLVDLCKYSYGDIAEDCELSLEYLLSVYQPPDLLSLIPTLSEARFYRVIKSIYRSEKQHARLLQVCFEDTPNPGAIFECIGDCFRPSAGLNTKQLEDVRRVILENIDGLVAADLPKAASTLDEYARDLHGVMVETLGKDEHAQFQYLQEILEPNQERSISKSSSWSTKTIFVEQYVRLLCDYDPHHVNDYIEKLKSGDLRLEEVLPALESSGVINATVILMAREGKLREAIDRLLNHLKTLESALLGLLEGAEDSPDAANTQEAADDLLESLEKYSRVGIWLCQGQTQAQAKSQQEIAKRKLLSRMPTQQALEEDLKPHEALWLDLIDTIVRVTRNASDLLEDPLPSAIEDDPQKTPTQSRPYTLPPYDPRRLLDRLRGIVQMTFTSLLAATSVPTSPNVSNSNISFLKILRAFLSRASESSPSLAHLRGVLGAVFSAYSYEEGLLSLANRLLDKDLFVRVEEVADRRKRGWRPLGQVCGGCGARAWGPGVGSNVWDSWLEHKTQDERELQALESAATEEAQSGHGGKGKGKATAPDGNNSAKSQQPGPDNIIVFSCRHLFHRRCLVPMLTKTDQTLENGQSANHQIAGRLFCPLESNVE